KNGNTVSCYGTGEESRDFIHISDVINFINIVISQNKGFDIFNCGTGQSCKIEKTLLELAKCYNKDIELCFDNIIHKGNPFSLVADIEKAKKIGFVPKVSIQNGLEKYAKWFKEEN